MKPTMTAGHAPPTLEVEHFSGVSRARLTGALDARLTMVPFAVLQGRGAAVVFDLDGVDHVTDEGVRSWLAIIRALPSERYYFVRCRPAVVRQLGLTAGFGGRGHVVSFFCPYRCAACGLRFEGVVDLRRHHGLLGIKAAPPSPCPQCAAPARFHGDPAIYLERASTWNLPRLALDVEAVIDGKAPPPALRLDKIVRGELTVLWLAGTLDKPERMRRHFDGLEPMALVVVGGVTAATAEGVDALITMLEASSAQVFLARVPAPVLTMLVAKPFALRRTRVVSVVIERRCGACGLAAPLDVLPWRDGEPSNARRCPACQASSLSPPPHEVLAALPTLAVSQAPADAAALLDVDAPPPYPAS